MSNPLPKSKIGYAGIGADGRPVESYYGWNPAGMGCSAGCKGCWARSLAKRMQCPKCAAFEVHLHEERLGQPADTKDAKVVLVGFMSDTFDRRRPDLDIRRILTAAEMAWAKHTYVWLTKRPEMMLRSAKGWDRPHVPRHLPPVNTGGFLNKANWHLGLSLCNQQQADAKFNIFRQIPGNLWLSLEPLWAAVDLTAIKTSTRQAKGYEFSSIIDALRPPTPNPQAIVPAQTWNLTGVIVGHDRNPSAPGTDTLEHIRDVVRQCDDAGINVYVKQIWVAGCLCGAASSVGANTKMQGAMRRCVDCGWPVKPKLLKASKPAEFAMFPEDLRRNVLPWSKPKE